MEEKIVVTDHIAEFLMISIIFIWNRDTIVFYPQNVYLAHRQTKRVNFSLCRNKVSVSRSCSNKSSSDLFANQIDRFVNTEKRRETNKCSIRFAKFSRYFLFAIFIFFHPRTSSFIINPRV